MEKRISCLKIITVLSATLTNTTVMNAIAGNATALGVMKSNYSSSMNHYISSNFSNGLNLANYRAGLKTYLFKSGNECTNITGGWQYHNGSNTGSGIKISAATVTDAGYAGTKSTVNITNYSYLYGTLNTNSVGYTALGLAFSKTLYFSQYLGWVIGSANREQLVRGTTGNIALNLSTAKTMSSLNGYNSAQNYYVMCDNATSTSTINDVWLQ